MQRFAEGRAYLEAAIAARPGDHEIAFNLGAACYALGDLVESERWFIEAVCTAANEAAHARALTQMAYPVLAEANLRQRLLRCRHPHRRRVAWLARARALR